MPVHNHMLEEEPRLFFVHFWAHGDVQELARGLRAALDQVATRPAEKPEEEPDLWRVRFGRAWFMVRRNHSGALLEWGAWQIVRDQDTLRDRDQLRAILRELGITE